MPLLDQITVTAKRIELLGTAETASVGVVADEEIQLTPAYRPGQFLETVPGLIVTLHSGEGKANQFLMRGYNLDHGTDLATFVDGMPINQPTHAHGQGYTDLNFMIPELADEITFTKGTYYPSVGDFGAVGSVRINYRDTIPDQLIASAGTFDFQRCPRRRLKCARKRPSFGCLRKCSTTTARLSLRMMPARSTKCCATAGATSATATSITGMYYHQLWTNTTDIPIRAIEEGFVPDRFGTLNPTDGGRAQRASLSFQLHETLGAGQFSTSAFYIYNQLHLWNDFTHYLIDPVHGDQEDQFENRRVTGGAADYTLPVSLAKIQNEISVGVFTRYDVLGVGRLPSEDRVPLAR
jgi:hypothetical protein